jgi:hypothetical protein
MSKSVAPLSLTLPKRKFGTRRSAVVLASSSTLKFRKSLTDLLRLLSFTKSHIEIKEQSPLCPLPGHMKSSHLGRMGPAAINRRACNR